MGAGDNPALGYGFGSTWEENLIPLAKIHQPAVGVGLAVVGLGTSLFLPSS